MARISGPEEQSKTGKPLGNPFAWAHLKLMPISLWPIGKTIVSEGGGRLLRPRASVGRSW